MDPLGWYFFLKIHVLFFLIESSSVLMALSQYLASGALLASKKLIGSFSTR